jgi:hypothetical protein
MSAAAWLAPLRDAEYEEMRGICLDRGLLLQSANRYGEAIKWGADYRILDRSTRSTLIEADSLDELRRWLRVGVHA